MSSDEEGSEIDENLSAPNTEEEELSASEDEEVAEDEDEDVKGSAIWLFFTQVVADGKRKAKCKSCKKFYSRTSSASTTSLANHLKSKHAHEHVRFLEEKKRRNDARPKKRKLDPQQQTLPSMFKPGWNPSSAVAKKYTTLIAKMIAGALLPYSFVENKYFLRLMKAVLPQYKVPCRTTFSRSIIPKMYSDCKEKMKAEIGKDLHQTKSISLTTDGWSSRNIDSYMSLTIHYMLPDGNYKSFLLCLRVMEEAHTADNLKEIVISMAEEWGITEGLAIPVYVVTDNAPNLVAAVRRSWWLEWLSCFAHTIQLVVDDAKKETAGINALFTKLRALVGHYKRSPKARNELKLIASEEEGLRALEVIQYVDTRWWTELEMMVRLLYLYPAICSQIVQSRANVELLTVQERGSVEGLVKILKPVQEATNMVCSDKVYPSLSAVIPMLHCMNGSIAAFISANPNQPGVRFARNLIKALNSRFPGLNKASDVHVLATALDPRFKAVLADSSVVKLKLKTAISLNVPEPVPVQDQQGAQAQQEEEELPEWFRHFSNAVPAANAPLNPAESVTAEINKYLDGPVISPKSNPYDWWKQNAALYPNLAMVACHYLPIPATQIKSESTFSNAGNVVTPKRQTISTQHTEELVFLHSNLDYYGDE